MSDRINKNGEPYVLIPLSFYQNTATLTDANILAAIHSQMTGEQAAFIKISWLVDLFSGAIDERTIRRALDKYEARGVFTRTRAPYGAWFTWVGFPGGDK